MQKHSTAESSYCDAEVLNMRSRTILFLLSLAVLASFSWDALRVAVKESLQNGYSSHVVLVPFIAAYLIWSGRKKIFARPSWSWRTGLAIAAVGIVGLVLVAKGPTSAPGVTSAAGKLACILVIVVGSFIASYGATAFKSAILPLLLLLLILPVPSSVTDRIVFFLQTGSAELTDKFFSILGVPFYREGFVLHLPGVSIEIAKECSGINSSIALLITMLLLACETLGTKSRRFILVLLAIPMSLVKNAVRIVTLTLLALYVDPSFLNGRLHHQGGFVFYLLTLALMYPVWRLLKRTEYRKLAVESVPEAHASSSLPPPSSVK
jgi:exosortase